MCAHEGFSKKKYCGISTYDKWNFKPQISSIFHFDRVSDGEWLTCSVLSRYHPLVSKYQIIALHFLPKTCQLIFVQYRKSWKTKLHCEKLVREHWKADEKGPLIHFCFLWRPKICISGVSFIRILNMVVGIYFSMNQSYKNWNIH